MSNVKTVLTPFGKRRADRVHLVPQGGQVVHADDDEIHVEDATGNVVNVEKNTVLTPFGERLASNVHLVPEGGQVVHVNDEVHLVDSSGKVLHVAKNDGTKVLRTTPTGVGEATVPEINIRFTFAHWTNTNTNSSPIGTFTSAWSVPLHPPKYDNQTLALSSSMASANGDAILQLALQYGHSAPGGGPYWTVASWYLVGRVAYHTNLVNVGTGDSLEGIITLNSRRSASSGSTEYDYSCSFRNISGTSLPVITNEVLVGASESFESYNVESSDEYPPRSAVFYPINIRLDDGTVPAVAWTVVNGPPDGPTATINIQGASDADITFSYPNSNP